MKTYTLEISLNYIEPRIWRTLKINGDCSLADLHLALQTSMGWLDCHLHQFSKGNKCYGINDPGGWQDHAVIEESSVKIMDIFKTKNSKLNYEYDFGDSWEHIIQLKDKEDQLVIYPTCTAGENSCPPEDIGGVPGYIHFLEVVKNPQHPDYEEMHEWFGDESFDQKEFNLDQVNNDLMTLFPSEFQS